MALPLAAEPQSEEPMESARSHEGLAESLESARSHVCLADSKIKEMWSKELTEPG